MEQTIIRRFTVDKIATLQEKIGNKFLCNIRKNQLNNTDFTIISNNCWGGSVYRRYNLPYTSPTVGLYFFADEYIKFLENFEDLIHSPIKIVDATESKYYSTLKSRGQTTVPIGILNDNVEVVFLHYKTKEEAYEKWTRRCTRVNEKNLIVKFSEMNFCNEEHLKAFEQLDYKKKLLLLAKEHEQITDGIIIKKYTRNGEISNDTLYYDKFIDLEEFINS